MAFIYKYSIVYLQYFLKINYYILFTDHLFNKLMTYENYSYQYITEIHTDYRPLIY